MRSVMGSIADCTGGTVPYRMSKAAANMFTKCLAADWRDVTVISLHPGWVQTDMGGKMAPLKPEDSVAGMRRVIAGLTAKDSGKFLSFKGEELRW